MIYDIALFQTLKRNYAVNGHEMYCTCVFFYLCITPIWTRTVTELPNRKKFYLFIQHLLSALYTNKHALMRYLINKYNIFMTKCNGFYIIMLLYSI